MPTASTTTWSRASRYGADNRRLFRRVTGPAGTSTCLYLRGSGAEPIAEIRGDGTVRIHVAGPRGLTALRVVDAAGTASDYFVATDALGSVRALSDVAGNLVGGYDYRPYGGALGSDFGSRPAFFDYRFTDRQLDPSGLYDFRARLYAEGILLATLKGTAYGVLGRVPGLSLRGQAAQNDQDN